MGDGMNEKTQNDYRNLARHFYEKHGLSEEIRTPKRIADALERSCGDYRPNYFRRLRNALEFDQRDKGFDKAADRIKSVQNPLTKPDTPIMLKRNIKPKQRRIKSISKDDTNKILNLAAENKDAALVGAVMISRRFGVRPKELFNIRPLGNGRFFIEGAKKRSDRGLDRIVKVDSTGSEDRVLRALHLLDEFKSECEKKGRKSTPEHLIQERLNGLTKRLWPRRKARPTLYTFRHQIGSNLKGSGMERSSIAYLMGHQSTESVEVYGDKRSGKSPVNISPGVSQEHIKEVVRENHQEPRSQQKVEQTRERNRSYDDGFGFTL